MLFELGISQNTNNDTGQHVQKCSYVKKYFDKPGPETAAVEFSRISV